MTKSKVYFLPFEKVKLVPKFIEKVAGEFFKRNDFVAIKLHFGEKGNTGFIKPEWVRPVVDLVKEKKANPFLTDTNTIYRGQRADAVNHLMLANGHGFKMEKVGAPVFIADGLRGNEYKNIEVSGQYYKSVKIATGIRDAHAMIVLSHTKGHILTGYGGALKNLGMGCASKGGKYEQHASIFPELIEKNCIGCAECIKWCSGRALKLIDKKISLNKELCVGCGECILACTHKAIEIPWDGSSEVVQKKVIEYAIGAVKDKPVCYVNYMHRITRYCDCFADTDEAPLIDDVGILVSTDPVAIDQSSIDLINKKAGRDLFRELNDVDYSVQLVCAEDAGLGRREYELIL